MPQPIIIALIGLAGTIVAALIAIGPSLLGDGAGTSGAGKPEQSIEGDCNSQTMDSGDKSVRIEC
jgi:hypothetical protein